MVGLCVLEQPTAPAAIICCYGTSHPKGKPYFIWVRNPGVAEMSSLLQGPSWAIAKAGAAAIVGEGIVWGRVLG